MKKKLVISIVAVATVTTALVATSTHANRADRVANRAAAIHAKVPGSTHATSNVLAQAVQSNVAASPNIGSPSSSSRIDASSVRVQRAVSGFSDALQLPSGSLSNFTGGQVGEMATFVRSHPGATATQGPGGITLSAPGGEQSTFTSAAPAGDNVISGGSGSGFGGGSGGQSSEVATGGDYRSPTDIDL